MESQSINKNQESWDKRYNTMNYVFGTNPEPFLKEAKTFINKDDMVLSIGGGEGKNEVFMALSGAKVHNIDISSLALDKAEKLAKFHGTKITTQAVDIFDYEWPENSFNTVAWFFVHFSPVDSEEIIKSILKSLKPGGLIIGSLFAKHTGADKNGGKISTRYDMDTFKAFTKSIDIEHLEYGSKRRGNLEPEPTLNFILRKKD